MSTCSSEFYYSSPPKLRIIKLRPFLSDNIAKLELFVTAWEIAIYMHIPFLVDACPVDLLTNVRPGLMSTIFLAQF